MKLRMGSLINCLADNAPAPPDPKIGDGATIVGWSDRHAATVESVRRTASGKLVIGVKRDSAKRIDKNGMSECQEYEFTPNPRNPVEIYREMKDGVLRASGGSTSLHVGTRDEYYDYSF